jgi:hypothetical protein
MCFSCLAVGNVKFGSNKQDSGSLGLVGKILRGQRCFWKRGVRM